MSPLTGAELWDRYETELRDLYDRKSRQKPIYPLFHLIEKHHRGARKPLARSVLEMGFGNGGLLTSLAELYSDCWAFDISPKNVALTEQRFRESGIANVTFRVHDVLTSAPVGRQFDDIVMSHLLEHFDDSELGVVLARVKEMLAPGGLLFAATPYKKAFNPRICPDCGHVFEIDGHKQVFDEENMARLLEGSGFEVVQMRHFNPDHFFWGESLLFRLKHWIRSEERVTQLEIIARPVLLL